MTSKVPQTLALDFDGVLCDGLLEYFQSTWRTYCQIWSPESRSTNELAPVFYRLRPVIETGWEMPVLLRAILQGFTEPEILEDWQTICSRIVAEENLDPKDLAARIDTVRDQWIETDLAGWLKIHRFYPGVAERLRQWVEAEALEVFIVTTKEGRFVQQLLQQEGIQLAKERILGKERQQLKSEILRSFKGAPIWFVEDRLPALKTVAGLSDLAEIRLFLADWGYNTPTDQAVADQDSRIQLLALDQFTQDFSVWREPRPL